MPSSQGPCRREMEDTLNHLKFLNMLSPRGIHIPNCDKKGFYKKKQVSTIQAACSSPSSADTDEGTGFHLSPLTAAPAPAPVPPTTPKTSEGLHMNSQPWCLLTVHVSFPTRRAV